jgi:hypothetical protein
VLFSWELPQAFAGDPYYHLSAAEAERMRCSDAVRVPPVPGPFAVDNDQGAAVAAIFAEWLLVSCHSCNADSGSTANSAVRTLYVVCAVAVCMHVVVCWSHALYYSCATL